MINGKSYFIWGGGVGNSSHLFLFYNLSYENQHLPPQTEEGKIVERGRWLMLSPLYLLQKFYTFKVFAGQSFYELHCRM